jgi:hypothetical protein
MVGVKIGIKVALVLFFLIQIVVFFFQERLIFFPETLSPGFPFRFELPFQEVSIPVPGATINALRFHAKNPKGIIVYFHGNAGSLQEWGAVGESLARLGYDALVCDYRGFGKSTGKIDSESQLMGDARIVLESARREFSDDRIVLFGRSLGSGIATQLATEMNPKLLILESPYLSVQSRARAMFPFVLPFILRYPLRSDLFAPRVKAPVLLIHGTEDEIIPFASGMALSRTFASSIQIVEIPGGHHNDLSAYARYRDTLSHAL